MEHNSLCRCCLAQGFHKDLNSTYVWLDKKEVYSHMLQECFNIVISSTTHTSSGICDTCITTLRSSLTFKHMVQDSEQELMNRARGLTDGDVKPLAIKLEPKQDSDGDDSDDYFLADAARELPEVSIKKEVKEPPKKRTKKNVTKKSESWRADDIKSIVSRLTTVNNKGEGPQLTIKKKSVRKIIIHPEALKQSKINLKWSSRINADKRKHRDNLQTILQYSNVVPFRNKSLLGYMCGYCTENYPDPVDLRTHTESNHQKDRLNFKNNFDMTEYNVQVDITDLICNLCDAKMDNLNILKEHLVKVHKKQFYNDIKDHILQFRLKKGEVYDCAMCSATYETFKMLKQHMNLHYNNYTCSKCDTAFATKRSLNAHSATHQEGSFKCDQCEKVFPSKAKKQYHEKMKHLGTRNISNCPFCNEPFRSYYQRNQHLVKVHNSEAQYKCNICNKSYILKSLLMYHIKKNHLMERNCQCTECGYRFFSKKALKAHMVKHTGERNYQCEVCHKSYARKYTLREHMRIHNNDRRFKCNVCGMSFVQKCSLKSHLLSNHGISMAASDITSTEVESELQFAKSDDASKDSSDRSSLGKL